MSSKGPLYIKDKRWYYRLVSDRVKNTTGKSWGQGSRALLEDYTINQISGGLVVCYTPKRWPGSNRAFVTKDGRAMHLFAFFSSYIEFSDYMKFFIPSEQSFYEVVFGELPQKPHFDIDIDRAEFVSLYPGEDIWTVAPTLMEIVVQTSIEVIGEVDIEHDVLIYSSNGNGNVSKYSYHIVINNKCHAGNKEAKAFYDEVMVKVAERTGGKYLKFVDASVYSPRQQFRIVGCQKWESGRPKLFHEVFALGGVSYTHRYIEHVANPEIKGLAVLYESLVGFTSGCSYLPSLIPVKISAYSYESQQNMGDLDDDTVNYCMRLLREKMTPCPFSVREVQGNRICLKREAPSRCPMCGGTVVHDHDNPYMYLINGKIFWDCRRGDGRPKFFVGYCAYSDAEGGLQQVVDTYDDEDRGGTFTFGDYEVVVAKALPSPFVIPVIEVIPVEVPYIYGKLW